MTLLTTKVSIGMLVAGLTQMLSRWDVGILFFTAYAKAHTLYLLPWLSKMDVCSDINQVPLIFNYFYSNDNWKKMCITSTLKTYPPFWMTTSFHTYMLQLRRLEQKWICWGWGGNNVKLFISVFCWIATEQTTLLLLLSVYSALHLGQFLFF